jgi:ubiquinone biosynthesis protein UbiJ
MAFGRGFAKGYQQGAKEMKEYLTEQIIYSINQDAVLRMTADVDTLERVVEVIEAVRDIGKAQS